MLPCVGVSTYKSSYRGQQSSLPLIKYKTLPCLYPPGSMLPCRYVVTQFAISIRYIYFFFNLSYWTSTNKHMYISLRTSCGLLCFIDIQNGLLIVNITFNFYSGSYWMSSWKYIEFYRHVLVFAENRPMESHQALNLWAPKFLTSKWRMYLQSRRSVNS